MLRFILKKGTLMTSCSGLFHRRGLLIFIVIIFKLEPEAVFKQAHLHGFDVSYVSIRPI
jgi:hypothetical protein